MTRMRAFLVVVQRFGNEQVCRSASSSFCGWSSFFELFSSIRLEIQKIEINFRNSNKFEIIIKIFFK